MSIFHHQNKRSVNCVIVLFTTEKYVCRRQARERKEGRKRA